MINPEEVVDRVLGGELDAGRLGHFTHPLTKTVYVAVCLILCVVLITLKQVGHEEELKFLVVQLLALFAVQVVDFRAGKILRSALIAGCSGSIIILLLWLPGATGAGLRSLGAAVFGTGIMRAVAKYVSLSDICIIGFAVLGARGLTRFYAMDTVWLGRLIRSGRGRHAYFLTVMTYLISRRYLSKAGRDAMYAARSKWFVTRKKIGWWRGLWEGLRLFIRRFLTGFTEIAGLAETICNERDLLNTRKYRYSRFSFRFEDIVVFAGSLLILASVPWRLWFR